MARLDCQKSVLLLGIIILMMFPLFFLGASEGSSGGEGQSADSIILKNHKPPVAGPFKRLVPKPGSVPIPNESVTYPDAEPEVLPSWVLFGQGLKSMEERRYAEAAVLFRRSIERRGIYPEAEFRLALASGISSDLTLQEALLEKALDEVGFLTVSQDEWSLEYALADLYTRKNGIEGIEKAGQAMDTYRDILKKDVEYQDLKEDLTIYYDTFLATGMDFRFQSTGQNSKTAGLTGLDRLLFLYHHPAGPSLRAHQELAKLYWANNAPDQAIAHSLFALTAIFSTVIDSMKEMYPDYVFTGLDELFVDSKSEFYLGQPENLQSSRGFAGAANPGWMVKYQPIWDYLKDVKSDETLAYLLRALDAKIKKEQGIEVPQETRRTAMQAGAEIRKRLSQIFPKSPWIITLKAEEKSFGQARH